MEEIETIVGRNAYWCRGQKKKLCLVIAIYDCLGGVAKIDLRDGLSQMIVSRQEIASVEAVDLERESVNAERLAAIKRRREAARSALSQAYTNQWIDLNADCIRRYLATSKREPGMTNAYLAKAKRLGLIP